MLNLKHIFSLITVVIMLFSISGCTNVFLQPNKVAYTTPDKVGVPYQSYMIDNTLQKNAPVQINAWLMNPDAVNTKPSVLFFHGNAENMSSHFFSVYWLAKKGYPVFLIDYRGYGASTGKKDLTGSLTDIIAGTLWYMEKFSPENAVVFGQSLGASMSVAAFANALSLNNSAGLTQNIDGYIFESGFASYKRMAGDAFGNHWLTYIFKYPAYLLVSDKYQPEKYIALLEEKPKLIIHSRQDGIVPFKHSQALYDNASPPKTLLEIEGPHIGSGMIEKTQQTIEAFILDVSK